MSAFNTIVTLTLTSTGKTFDLGSANIVRVVSTAASGSNVSYYDNGATVREVIVNETAASIATNSQMLIAITSAGNIKSYINPNRIIDYAVNYQPLTGTPVTTGITAHAGGGQGSAVALTTQYNIVSTVATNGDSVKLPTASLGAVYFVQNTGAHTLAVFPNTSGTINGGAANASVNIVAGSQGIFTSSDSTNWNVSYPIQSTILFDGTGTTNIKINVQESVATLESEISAITTSVVLATQTYTSTTNIVAHAGGGQGSATALTTEYNNVTTVASAGDSVVLPSASAGVRSIIKNNGTHDLAVFPATGDTINGGAANASITLPVGEQMIFSAIDSTDWESDVLVDNTYSATTGIIAHAGGGQGSATAITTFYNNVTTVATAADSVVLPTAFLGNRIIIKNSGANDLAIFPASGASINGGSANASLTCPVGSTKIFDGISATDWETESEVVSSGKGTAARPALSFSAQSNMGLYWVSATQMGLSVAGVLQAIIDSGAGGILTGVINEQVGAAGVAINGMTVYTTGNKYTAATSITAHAGGGQGSATILAKEYNNITVSATAGDSVVLPTAALGLVVTVINTGAAASDVFPATGGTINGGAANAAVSCPVGARIIFVGQSATAWLTGAALALGTDIIAAKEVDHNITVTASTTAATVGGAIIINGGVGSTSGAGGAANINGGAGGATGAGGAVVVTSGAATNATSGTGAASGAVAVKTGTSATATTGTGGAGATIAITGSAGGVATGAAGIGGAGSATTVTSGAGGAASDAASGNAGAGGASTITAGAGGAASGSGGAAGGAGGAASLIAGAGGAAAGTASPGVGGAIAITTGAGGAKSGTGNAVGAAGGAVTVTLGAGGNTASNGANNAGAAGNLTITGGAGGNASAGTGNGGTGSSIILTPGAGGTSAGGTAGVQGFVVTSKALLQNHTTAAINSTNTATAAQVATGYITSTSAAGTTITLPTGTLLGAALGAAQGTIHKLYIDNTAGASTVTVAVAVNGILSAAAVANGASQGLLTVPSGVTGQAEFTLMFSSGTAYTFTRTA